MLLTRTFGRLATAAIVTGAAIAMTMGPASADDSDGRASCSDTRIYLNDDWACVVTYGDHVQVSDQTWDGNGTRVQWRSTADNQKGVCTDYNGSENGYEDCNEDLPEHGGISYQLQQISDGEIVDRTEGWSYVDV